MNTIGKFDFDRLSLDNKNTLYSKMHPLVNDGVDTDIKLAIPASGSIWIDSGAPFLHGDCISLESVYFKDVFDKKSKHTHFAADFTSDLICRALQKVYKPSCIVFYYSPFLRYMTLSECKAVIETYKKHLPQAKIILVIDLKFLLFHRIRLTNDDAVKILAPKKKHKITTFQYYMEF